MELLFIFINYMNDTFKPTWLYIKQHNTGLKYFGKTIRKDPIRYLGSGDHWKQHLAKHGANITTTWCQLFTNKDELVDYALSFSKDNNIVESKEWANLIVENGLDGANTLVSEETRAKMSAVRKGKPKSEETRAKMSVAWKDRGPRSDEHCAKLSLSKKGKGTGVDNPMFGRKQSAETRAKISAAMKKSRS
jgi:hypothetical protein